MSFLLFFIAHLLAVIFPGQTFIGMTNLSIKHGFTATLPFLFGIAIGNFIFASIAIFGLTEVIFKYKIISIAFYLGSASYLIYFGSKLLIEKPTNQGIKIKTRKAFLSGLFIELSNPKSIFFTISLVSIILKPESSLIFKLLILAWVCFVSLLYELLIVLLFSIFRGTLLKYLRTLNTIFAFIIFLFSFNLIYIAFVNY